jgi:hypothetical protein
MDVVRFRNFRTDIRHSKWKSLSRSAINQIDSDEPLMLSLFELPSAENIYGVVV